MLTKIDMFLHDAILTNNHLLEKFLSNRDKEKGYTEPKYQAFFLIEKYAKDTKDDSENVTKILSAAKKLTGKTFTKSSIGMLIESERLSDGIEENSDFLERYLGINVKSFNEIEHTNEKGFILNKEDLDFSINHICDIGVRIKIYNGKPFGILCKMIIKDTFDRKIKQKVKNTFEVDEF